MIKLLSLDIDRAWTSEAKMSGTAVFDMCGHEFRIKLNHEDCQAICDKVDTSLTTAAERQATEQLNALKKG
jgi:hypothetical protein